MSRKPPSSRETTRRAGLLGNDARHEYIQLRERYKGEGLSAKEACERASIELKIHERFEDYRRRKVQSELMGAGVPLTPAEASEANPGYRPPARMEPGEVGDQILSLAEQIKWVKHRVALVRNGGDHPKEYPSPDVLYWYQIASTRPGDFDKIVMKLEAPEKNTEDWIFQDGEHQFSEVEKQIREALSEVGDGLVEAESGFAEILKGESP